MGARKRTAYLTLLLGLCLAVPADAQTDVLPNEQPSAAAQRLCDAAKALGEAHSDEASALYLRALTLSPTERCALDGVAPTPKPTQAQVDALVKKAGRLKALGLESEASEQIKAAAGYAEANPDLEVNLPAEQSWDNWFKAHVVPWLTILAAVIVLAGALWLLFQWLQRWLGGKLIVQPFGKDRGDEIAVAFRTEYRRLRQRSSDSPAVSGDLDAESSAPDDVASLVPQVNALAALARWIVSVLPFRRVHGNYESSIDVGQETLRVRLASPLRPRPQTGEFGLAWDAACFDEITLTAGEWLPGRPSTAEARTSTALLLATPAVVWTVARFDPLRRRSWEAEAYLALGQRLHDAEPIQARASYYRSISNASRVRDVPTRNRIVVAAKTNLVALEMRSDGGAERAADWLECSLKGASDYARVRIAYWRAVISMECAIDRGVVDPDDLAAARIAARQHVELVARTTSRRFRDRSAPGAVALLLATVVAGRVTNVLRDPELAAIATALGMPLPPKPAEAVAMLRDKYRWPNAGLAYNLALYYARSDEPTEAFWLLRVALSLNATLRTALLHDAWLQSLSLHPDEWDALLTEFGLSPDAPAVPAGAR